MSYDDAMKQFRENVALTEGKRGDLLSDTMWNLNAGLMNITEGLARDLAEIKSRLGQLESK